MTERRYNLRSLPGGRRGASGADAGCSSIRTIGDAELSRRVPVEQTTTADNEELSRRTLRDNATADDGELTRRVLQDNTTADDVSTAPPSAATITPSGSSYRTPASPTTSTASTYLSVDVAHEAHPAESRVPTTNKSQMRRRWTPEHNEFILRTYLQLTLLEQDTSDYLTPLHSKFIERYPLIDVPRQRLGDQRRAIIRNKLLPQEKIKTIYEEVKMELQSHTTTTQSLTLNPSQQSQTTLTSQHTQHSQSQLQRTRWTNEMNEDVIRSYFRVTELETNKTGYRKALHQDFINRYPHLSVVSEQRVADQRRRIFTDKVISTDRLNCIRQEVADEMRIQTSNTEDRPTIESTPLDSNTDFIYNIDPELFTDTQQFTNTPHRNPKIDETFQDMIRHFSNTQPTERLYIPKQKASKKLAKIVQYINDTLLPEHINDSTDFITLQTIIYCSAITAAKINGSKIVIPQTVDTNRIRRNTKPEWQIRLEKKITDLRAKIGRVTQYINGNTSSRLKHRVDAILEQYKVHSIHEGDNTHPIQVLDTLKQKLSVAISRLKRYNACTLRKYQNTQFYNNEKQFYRTIRNSNTTRNDSSPQPSHNSPPPDELRSFWASIWEQPMEHDDEADWVHTEEINNTNTPEMQFDFISTDTFHRVLSRQHNWKAPGSDHIHNYWYKKLTHTHPFIHNHINYFIHHPETLPQYITTGITYMLPKDPNDTLNPAKYRPITCLQTLYKIITSCLAELIYKHSTDNNILTEQQKGCRKYSQGCKEQLTIDSVILRKVHKNKKDIYSMYIDYKKAYDSVPHSWLLKILNIYKIHPCIINFLQNSIKNWSTSLRINTANGTINTDSIRIQRGIFQGDALSPLWFCLALNPLSNSLNSHSIGYPLNYNEKDTELGSQQNNIYLNHLLYMDDIKLYATSEENLNQLANITEKFSKDICMEFGIDKCKINSIKAGQNHQHYYVMNSGEQIDSLDENSAYKYLGYNQSKYIEHKDIKVKLQHQFRSRLNAILKTHLNSRNMIKAINTFAIPILTYSFGIISWSKTELKNIQRLINVTMTKNRKHHPRSCLQRITLPRSEGGRGLIDINNLHNSQIVGLREYFHKKAHSSVLHNAIVQNDHKFTPLNLNNPDKQPNEIIIDKQTKLDIWNQKSLHGRHLQDLNHLNVDKSASNEWLRRGELFPETEGFMIAIQDQVIETRNYKKYITKTLSTDICRRCNSAPETIQHITGACKAIVQTEYKHRHDQIANIIHQKLAQKYRLIPTTYTPYYKYVPDNVMENRKYKLYYDRAILTDKTTHYNRPDITIVDKDNKTALIIDIAIPNTHNLQNTIAEKLSKYSDLKDEITRMWQLNNVTIVPIVLSTTGVIPKQLHRSIQTLDLPPHIYTTLQKAAILNTCRIVRKFLQINQNQHHTDFPNSLQQTPCDLHLA